MYRVICGTETMRNDIKNGKEFSLGHGKVEVLIGYQDEDFQ